MSPAFLLPQPSLVVLFGSLAAGAFLGYLYSRGNTRTEENEAEPEQEPEQEREPEPEPELHRLRTRPLKPAIDLRIYTYGDH